MVVGEVVECGNMFGGEYGAGIEGADKEVLRGGCDLGWVVCPHREAV